MVIILADIGARARIEPFGTVVEVSPTGNPPATHCYIEIQRVPIIDTDDRRVRLFHGSAREILKASGLTWLVKPSSDWVTSLKERIFK